MSDQVWWYATRAAGLMTWSTAVAAVIVGLLLSTRTVKARTGPWMLDLHRFLGGLSVLFLVAHVLTLSLDSYVDFGLREVFIPGESTWNAEAAAWGIIAMYTLILVEVSSLLRRHISQSVWRTMHWLSVMTAVAGTYHAVLGGTDVGNPMTWIVAGAGSAAVIGLMALRLRRAVGGSDGRASKASEQEALLQEMRDRLNSLPVSDNSPAPEIIHDGAALPQRAPAGPENMTVADPFAPNTRLSHSHAEPFGLGNPPTPAVDVATVPPPPPVPDAIDPITGEPDQAAYTAWLVEWLAYAEQYGEDTPDDPNRA